MLKSECKKHWEMQKISRKQYIKLTDFFKNNKSAKNVLKFVYKIFPLIVFASYPILLVYTFLWQKDLFLKSLTVPAGVFLGITLLRIIIKEERPYVRYGVAPVLQRTASQTVCRAATPQAHSSLQWQFCGSMCGQELHTSSLRL